MQKGFFKAVIEVHGETCRQFVRLSGIFDPCRIDLYVTGGRKSRFDDQKRYGKAKQKVRKSTYHDIRSDMYLKLI